MRIVEHLTRRLSLRTRLTLWVTGIAAVIQLVIGTAFYLYQSMSVEAIFNDHLRLRSDGMVAELARLAPSITVEDLDRIGEEQAKFSLFSGFAMAVFDADGHVVASSYQTVPAESFVPEVMSISHSGDTKFEVIRATETQRIEPNTPKTRAVTRRFKGKDGRVYILRAGTPDSTAQQMMRLVFNAILITFPTGVLVAGLSGWFIAGLAVRPLEMVRRSAEQLTPEHIDRRLDPSPAPRRTSPEQMRLEEALESARQRLAAAFAAQERFMSNVSHELKTPIAVLLTEAQTIDLKAAPPEMSEYVRGAMDELRRLGSMIDSFLLLTRVREGRSPTHNKYYNINELVMESIEHCMPMAVQHNQRLRPNLCDADEPAMLRGDPSLLRTMIDNLVRNAIRFNPPGGSIDVTACCHADSISVSVRDWGIGIPEAIIERIFDRFVQASEEQRRGRGHGLGLEIAQGIAELHGGHISARNCPPPGGGCEFTVTLPRADNSLREREIPQS